MLFKFTTQQIEEFKNLYTDAESCLIDLVRGAGIEKTSYPSIKYANSIEEGWREFSLCFHEDCENVYQNMLRPKYKDNNPAFGFRG